MKVKELIAELKKYNPELKVCFPLLDTGMLEHDEHYFPANSVCETQPMGMVDGGYQEWLEEVDMDKEDAFGQNYIAIE